MARFRYLILSVLIIAFPACRANAPVRSSHLSPEMSAAGLDHQVYYETREIKSELGSRRTEWRTKIDAHPEKVWSILTDYENYPNLIPSAIRYRIIERSGNSVVVETRGRRIIKLKGRARYEEDPDNFVLRWKKIKSNISLNSGYWKLTPIEHDGRIVTEVFHYVYSKPGALERMGNMIRHLEEEEVTMLRNIQELAENQ